MKTVISNHVRQRKKRGKRHMWSKVYRKTFLRRMAPVLHLPKRNSSSSLTYAEAQKFVDVDIDGSIHRLDISQSYEIVDIGCGKLSNVNGLSSCKVDVNVKCEKMGNCPDSVVHNCLEPRVRVVEDSPSFPAEEFQLPQTFCRRIEEILQDLDEQVEYDMDEQDVAWLGLLNDYRQAEKLLPISVDSFEFVIDRFEKESYAASLAPVKSNYSERSCKNISAPCVVCFETESQQSNCLLSCDSCAMIVHQDCYGVPYVPDGTWICRTCLRSTCSVNTGCCLCPVAGGALKQTDDGRFAHIICARWIPEVRFGSAVYLEPIEHISKVPLWRRRLTCSICKLRGNGACVRCEMPHCETAFHATCAQNGGVYMRLQVPRGMTNCSRAALPRRTIFCDLHRPVETIPISSMPWREQKNSANMLATSPEKLADSLKTSKKAKKQCIDERNAPLHVTSTSIQPKQLLHIADSLPVRDRQQAINRLYSYWLLKRQVHRNMPLLDRLRYYMLYKPILSEQLLGPNGTVEFDQTNLVCFRELRHSMDTVKHLLELVCNREKMKLELLNVHELATNLRLQPLPILLLHTLDQVRAKDHEGYFTYPVPVDEVPDYLEVISQPMDFATMETKIESHVYRKYDDFESDFMLIVNNCLKYNEAGSLLHKAGLRLQRECKDILVAARRISDRAGYCQETGLHLSSAPVLPTVESPVARQVLNGTLASSVAAGVSLEDQLQLLLWRLDVLQVMKSHRKALECNKIRRRIAVIRRMLAQQKLVQLGIHTPRKSPDQRCSKISSPSSSPGASIGRSQRMQRRRSLLSRGLNRVRRCVASHPRIRGTRHESTDSAISIGTNGVSGLDSSVDCSTQVEAVKSSGRQLNGLVPNGFHKINGFTSKAVIQLHCLQTNGKGVVSSSDSSLLSGSNSNRNSDGKEFKPSEATKTDFSANKNTRQATKCPVRTSSKVSSKGSVSIEPLLEANENDSSYESSYSVNSDSDVSSDHNGTTLKLGDNGKTVHARTNGSCNGHAPSVSQGLKATRSKYSIDANDITTAIKPGDIVWAKTTGNFWWYPATVISEPHDGVVGVANHSNSISAAHIPNPPREVLEQQYRHSEPVYLVRLLNRQHDWLWLPRHKLEPLGISSALDQAKIALCKDRRLRATLHSSYYNIMKTRLRLQDQKH